MSNFYMACALIGFIMLILYITNVKFYPSFDGKLLSLLAIGIIVRFIAINVDAGFYSDINTFKYWAEQLYQDGLSQIYIKDSFADYPPGYLYVLYFIGFIKETLNITSEHAYTVLIKLPGMIFDILTAILLYKAAKKETRGELAFFLTLSYVLNPAVLINSAVWGQVDSIYAFFLLASLYLLVQKDYGNSYLIFVISVILKPQSLIITPIYLYSVYTFFKENELNKKSILKFSGYALTCFATLFIVMAPFTERLNFMPIINQYYDTLASYPYASVNAYNFYGFIGENWAPLEITFLGIPFYIWGTVSIVVITIVSFMMRYKSDAKGNYFFTAAFLVAGAFMFSIKMHERYIFPVMAFLLFAYIYKRDRRILFLYGGFTMTLLVNLIDILVMNMTGAGIEMIDDSILIVSFINLLLFGYLTYTGFKSFSTKDYEGDYVPPIKPEKIPWQQDFTVFKSKELAKMEKKDYIILSIITVIYAMIAFINLGDGRAPENPWMIHQDYDEVFEFEEEVFVTRIQFYPGPYDNKQFIVDFSRDGQFFYPIAELDTDSVFSWKEFETNATAKYARIISNSNDLSIFEMAFRDENDDLVKMISDSPLFDEQDLVPLEGTYKNGSYFDEIYHARTAYEFLNGLGVYEWTHPPLGKDIISIGIAIFGMNPFGWRFMGTLCGVLMVPLIYFFAKKMFKETFWATFATILFTFDFMHFAQTRIATIDSYTTFFIIAMYYYMYQYVNMSFYDTALKKTLKPLCLSGIFMGLSIATKWQGVYAAGGLAVIFFMNLFYRYREYVYVNNHKNRKKLPFKEKATRTILCCFGFFIFIPLIIYCLSYFMFWRLPGFNGIHGIIDNQVRMFNYHSTLVSNPSYGSPWWKWPIMLRPTFLYAHSYSETIKGGISTFGNPAVWWMGIVAFFYMIYRYKKDKSKTALFLIIAYLAQYLPWILVSRSTYIYHYFPSVPFIVLMITMMFKDFIDQKSRKWTYLYLGVTVLLFILFYPVLSGVPVSAAYVNTWLQWFSSWVFIL